MRGFCSEMFLPLIISAQVPGEVIPLMVYGEMENMTLKDQRKIMGM